MFEGPKRSRSSALREQLLSPSIQKLGLPIIGYIAIMFFLIEGPLFFPDQWAHWETITIIYALFLLPALIFSLLGVHPFDIPAWKSFAWFGVGSLGGFVVFKLLFSGAAYNAGFPIGGILPTAIFQIFVITYAEESMFRGFLLEVGQRRGTGVGILVSASLFSAFHLAAYSSMGLNFVAFGFAFIMGILFGFIYLTTRDFAGIGLVWGLHAAFNLVLLFG